MDITYFTSLFLVFLRILSFFIALEVIFPKSFPNLAKVMLSLSIAFFIMPYIDLSSATVFNNGLLYMWQCICEVITGIILGFFANLTFLCARIGGQFIDFQMGFSMMSVYDPATETNSSLIERLFYMFSIVLYFIIDGHIMLIKELVNSFNSVKLGTFVVNSQSVMVAFDVFTKFFTMGVKIALPIVLVLLITDLVLGLMSRTIPQLNVMILGIPVKVLLGLVCLIMTLGVMIKFMASSFNTLPDIYKEFYKLVPAALIFADADKTEKATPRKLGKAREKGQIPRSKDVPLVITLITITIVLMGFGDKAFQDLKGIMYNFLNNYLTTNLTEVSLKNVFAFSIMSFFKITLLFIAPIMISGIVGNILQTGFVHTTEPLKPKLEKINPMAGFKRMFSMMTIVELIKDLFVVSIVGIVGYNFLMSNYGDILQLNNLIVNYIPHAFFSYVTDIFKRICAIMIIIAVADFVYQKHKFNNDMKMTKQEIKDEFKEDEGDPEIKGKRKQRMKEIISRTMMNKVPDATVVITNPTHIAVALKYEKGVDSAPLVVAKGVDRTALKIKEIASENNVPIVENKPLARLMFSKVDIDDTIPVDMYGAVAEILAFVYKLKNNR